MTGLLGAGAPAVPYPPAASVLLQPLDPADSDGGRAWKAGASRTSEDARESKGWEWCSFPGEQGSLGMCSAPMPLKGHSWVLPWPLCPCHGPSSWSQAYPCCHLSCAPACFIMQVKGRGRKVRECVCVFSRNLQMPHRLGPISLDCRGGLGPPQPAALEGSCKNEQQELFENTTGS